MAASDCPGARHISIGAVAGRSSAAATSAWESVADRAIGRTFWPAPGATGVMCWCPGVMLEPSDETDVTGPPSDKNDVVSATATRTTATDESRPDVRAGIGSERDRPFTLEV